MVSLSRAMSSTKLNLRRVNNMRFNFCGCIHINWFGKTEFMTFVGRIKEQYKNTCSFFFLCCCCRCFFSCNFDFSYMHDKMNIYSLSSMGKLSCSFCALCGFFLLPFRCALKCVHWICIQAMGICIGVISETGCGVFNWVYVLRQSVQPFMGMKWSVEHLLM